MGRPKIDNPKSNPLHVRLDDECFNILKDYCEQENIPLSEGIRRGIARLRDECSYILVPERGDITSPITDRPTADPKKHETCIHMSDEDVRLLEYCAEKLGITKADVIRKGIREVYEKLKK